MRNRPDEGDSGRALTMGGMEENFPITGEKGQVDVQFMVYGRA